MTTTTYPRTDAGNAAVARISSDSHLTSCCRAASM